jgi:hypothetical protein
VTSLVWELPHSEQETVGKGYQIRVSLVIKPTGWLATDWLAGWLALATSRLLAGPLRGCSQPSSDTVRNSKVRISYYLK